MTYRHIEVSPSGCESEHCIRITPELKPLCMELTDCHGKLRYLWFRREIQTWISRRGVVTHMCAEPRIHFHDDCEMIEFKFLWLSE